MPFHPNLEFCDKLCPRGIERIHKGSLQIRPVLPSCHFHKAIQILAICIIKNHLVVLLVLKRFGVKLYICILFDRCSQMGYHSIKISCEVIRIDNILEVLQTVLNIIDVGLRVFVTLPEKSSYSHNQHKLLNYPFYELISVLVIVMAQSDQHFVKG